MKFPDYATAYANLKSGQIDAWVAPSQQAEGAVRPGDGTAIVENTFSLNNFVAWAVGVVVGLAVELLAARAVADKFGSIPAYPASHGCARVSNAAMDMIWDEDLMPVGSTVVVR
mgnify:CR=1 FL=1